MNYRFHYIFEYQDQAFDIKAHTCICWELGTSMACKASLLNTSSLLLSSRYGRLLNLGSSAEACRRNANVVGSVYLK